MVTDPRVKHYSDSMLVANLIVELQPFADLVGWCLCWKKCSYCRRIFERLGSSLPLICAYALMHRFMKLIDNMVLTYEVASDGLRHRQMPIFPWKMLEEGHGRQGSTA